MKYINIDHEFMAVKIPHSACDFTLSNNQFFALKNRSETVRSCFALFPSGEYRLAFTTDNMQPKDAVLFKGFPSESGVNMVKTIFRKVHGLDLTENYAIIQKLK